MKPLAIKKAVTISQTVVFEKPLNVSFIGSVFVSAVITIPINTIPPIPIGFRIKPTIVALKIAKR
ncbi:unnamed protein product [marine sediment metagenome]|uniref:Uncharacterized protein n=1 Tax=marine sediment metagenome TaxID=412755 RepID=X0X426_9ZZZZ